VLAKTTVQKASLAEQLILAQRHVELGRRIVERQNEIIAQKRTAHMSTRSSEELLSVFLASQKIFEDDLASLIKTNAGRRLGRVYVA